MMSVPADHAADHVSSGRGVTPPCFGDPGRVCPKGDDGFIQPQAACLPCEFFRSCLQQALMQAGLISGPSQHTPVVSKTTGFLKRWSNKKLGSKDSQEPPT
jgi:hypothetical protein